MRNENTYTWYICICIGKMEPLIKNIIFFLLLCQWRKKKQKTTKQIENRKKIIKFFVSIKYMHTNLQNILYSYIYMYTFRELIEMHWSVTMYGVL